MRDGTLHERKRSAELAALSVLQLRVCIDLLRGHGCVQHAHSVEDAMAEVIRILSDEFGDETFTSALDEATDRLWGVATPDRLRRRVS